MKDVFLVHITLPEFFSQKFYQLIQDQRKHINNLMENQVVLSYALDMERKSVWAYISAKSEKEIKEIVSKFPIIREVKFTIHELAFYDTSHQALPDLILN